MNLEFSKPRAHRRGWVAAVVSFTFLAGAGCSSSSDSNADKAPAGVMLPGTVNIHGTKTATAGMEVELDNFYFGPTFLEASAGQQVRLKLVNEGSVPHTFTIDNAAVDFTLTPGETKEIDVTAPASGFSIFYCQFHRSEGMQGAIFVS